MRRKRKKSKRGRHGAGAGNIKKRIIKVLRTANGGSITMSQLSRLIGEDRGGAKAIRAYVAELIREGKVRRAGRDRVVAQSQSIRFEGRLQVHPSGFGFVAVDGFDRDIFVSKGKMGSAFHNDLVEVKVERRQAGPRISGRITDVIERGMKKVVGRYHRDRGGPILKVEDKKFSFDFPVLASKVKNLRAGDVALGVIEGKAGRRNVRGVRIVRRIGKEIDVDSLTLSTIYLYGLENNFEGQILKALSAFPQRIRKNIPGRADLTKLPFITIDGPHARDFDDAVCLKREASHYRLLVSIADVSEYVDWDSPLDREARNRGVSIYFPDRVIPMLPERLSGDLCSLRERVNRLTMTVDARIDSRGELIGVNFYPSVIRSRKRLTYELVQCFLDGGDRVRLPHSLGGMLLMMQDLARVLHEKRVREGSFDFDLPEFGVTISTGGVVEKVVQEERLFSHRIIEEFMLLANCLVAKHLDELNLRFLYRVHEKPDPLKLREFFQFSAQFDSALEAQTDQLEVFLKRALAIVRDKPYEKIFNRMMLRSFKLARYSPENEGHFGLGFSKYTHFTSPIRRYPDLLVHRVLKFALGDEKFGKHLDMVANNLHSLGDHLTKKEKAAEQAERDVEDKLKALYMVGRVGEYFCGLITSVHPFGIYVELEDIHIEGLVHIGDLPEDVYYVNSLGFTLSGRYSGRKYSVGSRVNIRVKESDPLKGRVDFLLVEKGT